MSTPPSPLNTPDRLLRDIDAASALSCSRRFVHVLAARGDLPRVRLHGATRFRLSDVLRLIERGAA